MDSVDVVVAGAGVVGLAVARELARQGREVLVLEQCDAIGTGTSSRNSEVIHAGIYYPQGSLKARLCVEGKRLLYAYCDSHGVGYRRCGKLIVATAQEQLALLDAIRAQALANGVDDLQWLDRNAAQALEPALHCVGALLSPSTGIIDSHALMLSLQGELEQAGGMVVLRSGVSSAVVTDSGIELTSTDGTRLRAAAFINAAGLFAPELAGRILGLDASHVPNAYFAKGNYFTLAGRAPFSRLIYPVPEPGGLGVHLTLDLGGQAKFGPDVQWVSSAEDLVVDAARGQAFYAQVRKYWPNLPDGALVAGYAGIRPKLRPAHEAAADFLIQGPRDHGVAGLVNLFGIESPGLTSALAIAAQVGRLLQA